MIVKFLKNFNELLGEQMALGVIIVGILCGSVIYSVNDLNQQMKIMNQNITNSKQEATTEYAFNVIKRDLSGYDSLEEIAGRFDEWIEFNMSPQLGAVLTLCEHDTSKLQALVGEEISTLMCRKA